MTYIDVDKFAEKICNFQAIDEDSANAVIYLLRSQPSADVEEVKHAKWEYECLECSICKRNISEICDADSYLTSGIEDELLFCPFCGAKMDGGNAE